MKFLKSIFVCLFFILGINSTGIASPLPLPTGGVLYAKPSATGSGDCSSWQNACDLQSALDKASSGINIYAAAGTYLPTKPTIANDPRSATFQLKSGVGIYGGFPMNGGEWVNRDWSANLAILSGDIGNPDNKNDNSYHVVIASNVATTTILDGFTITAGNANYSYGEGGGILITDGSPSLSNLIISGNSASMNGGGIYNSGESVLTNITFTGNSTTDGSSAGGGGLYNYYCNPILMNVTFSGNIGYIYGGGIYNYSSNPILTNVTFSGNLGNHYGGGIYNQNSSPTLTNVTIAGNTAYWNGNGIYNYWNSNPTITNSIVYGNTGSPYQIGNENSSTTITYSDIQGGYAGIGNINADPLLDGLADNGGFTQTRALRASSPAIDKGNPSPDTCPIIDQRGYSRPTDGDSVSGAVCDMGAYEYASTPKLLRLSLYLYGSGSVVPPDYESWYPYGMPVTLTATASPGYSFSSWVGFGSNNPLNFNIFEDTIVTAYFTRDEYALSVVPEGSGSVTINPNQPIYFYGTEVTLTPIAEPGWTFSGWGGNAIVSTDNKLVITGNTNLTATFTQNEYTLSVVSDGKGKVTKSPDQASYHLGDEVTLTPIPDPDWAFTGWGGDASGSETPLVLIIDGDKAITANFTQTLFRYMLVPIYK